MIGSSLLIFLSENEEHISILQDIKARHNEEWKEVGKNERVNTSNFSELDIKIYFNILTIQIFIYPP